MVIVGLISLVVVGAVGIFLVVKGGLGLGTGSRIPECGETNEFFTHKPVNFEDIDSITPLGNLNPSGHTFPTDHLYLNIKEGKTDIPVYAPGDLWVTDLHLSKKYEDGGTTEDYSVNFKPCQEFSAYYIHINTLSEKLQEEFDKNYSDENCNEYTTGGTKFRMCFVEANVKLSAGELIGTTGYEGQRNFDLGANDLRIDTSFVAQYTKRAEWRGSMVNTVCPLDYFTPDLKTKLYSIVGDTGGVRRTIEPICGTVNQDEWGTAQGVWFLAGMPVEERGGEDEHAALVHHNVDPTQGVFSIGTSMEKSGLSTGAFNFIPRDSGLVNRDFDQVKPDGNIYCYENGSGVEFGNRTIMIIIKLLDEQTLRMEKLSSSSCGSGPWEFSSNYTDFER